MSNNVNVNVNEPDSASESEPPRKVGFRKALALCALLWLAVPGASAARVKVGSKNFTESVILGELVVQVAREGGVEAVHRRALGGTEVLWKALLRGEIDLYPEYTGTITQEILRGKVAGGDAISAALDKRSVRMTHSLGFSDNYAIGMRESRAQELGITTISDLQAHSDLRFGFSSEFMARNDGWPRVQKLYALPQQWVRGVDHDLAYRSLANGAIDATDLYTTDPEIAYYKLRVLQDSAAAFPAYEAVVLYRADLAERAPEMIAALSRLEGRISAQQMAQMNAQVKLEKIPEANVAVAFLTGQPVSAARETAVVRIWRHTQEHLLLVVLSLTAAIAIGLPLGIVCARRPRTGHLILGVVGVIQTIPSLALLVLMIPLFGIGTLPAILALFLYSLLPIVRNTYAGLRSIAPSLLESADALGLSRSARLRRVELPLASRSILAGIKTSAVINVGTATLGALIGAGGYGQPIMTGIRLDDVSLILQGAIPAALLALAVEGLFNLTERWLVPRGLRQPDQAAPPSGRNVPLPQANSDLA